MDNLGGRLVKRSGRYCNVRPSQENLPASRESANLAAINLPIDSPSPVTTVLIAPSGSPPGIEPPAFDGTFVPIVTAVAGVFAIIATGAGGRRVGWITPSADSTLTHIIAYIALPAFFLAKFAAAPELGDLATVWQPPLFGFLSTTIGFAVAYGVAKWGGRRIGLESENKRTAFAACVGICNYGYIPIPLITQFHEPALAELILHNVGVDLSLWTVGIYILAGRVAGRWRKVALSPPLLTVLFSIAMHAVGGFDYVPATVIATLGTLGGCYVPLGLLLSGAIMMDFAGSLRRRGGTLPVAIGVTMRMLLLPLAMVTASSMLPMTDDLRVVVIVESAMPSAIFPVVLVKMYGRDIELALRIVLVTSAASLLTIPWWIATMI